MPTFREDLHLGHKVALVDTDDIRDKAITGDKIADEAIDSQHIRPKAIKNRHVDDKAVDTRTLDDNAVTTPKIHDKAVTPEKLHPSVLSGVIMPPINKVDKKYKDKTDDLQNQIDSFNEHGLSVSNMFGNDPHIGVSQKTLTLAFNKIWSILEDITGEVLQGISMVVTPEYYIGEDGCNVHVKASTVDANGIFEKIAFYINDELVYDAENTDYLEFDTEITETSVVRCEAQIMGIPYTMQKTVTHYSSFFLGAGTSYTDIMDVEHVIPIRRHMRGAYDVQVADGEHIIIVVGDSLASGFIRADINGVEIGFTETTVVVDGNTYKVFTSENTYQAGTYNIDING